MMTRSPRSAIATLMLAAALAATFAIGIAGSAQAAPDACSPSIDGGVTCQARIAGCEIGAHVRDGGDLFSGAPASASADC